MDDLTLRRDALEASGNWEWWYQYGKCYLVPLWQAEEWKAHRGLGWKQGRIGAESEIDLDFQSMYKHAAMPAVESDSGLALQLLIEYANKHDLQWSLDRDSEHPGNVSCILYAVEVARDIAAETCNANPATAICEAIVKAHDAVVKVK